LAEAPSRRPDLLIVSLVFDDLREDDLRGDFVRILTPEFRAHLQSSRIGQEILQRFTSSTSAGNDSDDAGGLEGFGQRYLETMVTSFLSSAVPLWAKRSALRAHLLTDLYYLRNNVFGIKSTSVRRAIPIRYKRNMDAFAQLLQEARAHDLPVLTYIAPLRPDVSAPYDPGQYRAWKLEVEDLVRASGAVHLNLEQLVPGPQWGTYHADDIDFMHFQGSGHRLVAAALKPFVLELIARDKHAL